MELYKNYENISWDSFSKWGIHDCFRKLKETYCVCSLENIPSPKLGRYCSDGDQFFSPLPKEVKVPFNINSTRPEQRNKEVSHDSDVKSPETETNIIRIPSEQSQVIEEEHKDDSATVKPIAHRTSRSARLDITDKLIALRSIIMNNPVSPFRRSSKKTRFTKNKYLGRRSKYIGVTKNNIHWQALINVNHAKKYIGTFTDEIEAAKTYDLFALAMQGRRARLNFNYPPQKIVEMIDQYLAHRRISNNE